MIDILTNLSPSSLAVAIKENLYAFFHDLRYSTAAEVQESSHGLRWHTPIPHPWFNGFLGTQSPGDDTDQVIHENLDYFKSRDVSSITWWLSSSLEPETWSPLLLNHGFQYDHETPGMAIELDDLPPPENHSLTIRRVDDGDMLTGWTRAFVMGFEMPEGMTAGILELFDSLGNDPSMHHYLGLLGDEPVATSTLFLGAGVAGIYNVATLPQARRQGYGTVMTLVPLFDARKKGYRAGILQSSKMGYPVYQRLGFETLCRMDHFYWQDESSQEGT